MTAPSAHGYPDWGRFAASSDKLFDTFTQNNIAVTFTSSTYFVGDVPYIGLFNVVTGNGAELTLYWGDDASLTHVLRTDTIEFSNNCSIDITIPVKGPYLVLQWVPVATPYSINGVLVSSRTSQSELGNSAIRNVLIRQVNTPVGAGATVQAIAASIIPGPAVWNLSCTAATYSATVSAIHPDLTAVRLDTISQVIPFASRVLYLPPMLMVITVTNTSGAPASFSGTLMAKPMYDGT